MQPSSELTRSLGAGWLLTHIFTRNAVIGADQNKGVYCLGSCTLRNIWFEDVCEEAIIIKQESGTSTIIDGGAKGASDNVVQHNGGGRFSPNRKARCAPMLIRPNLYVGLVQISSYCVQDFGKLYRSCSNCKSQTKRQVIISQVIARNGKLLASVNANYGDVATIDTKSNSYTGVNHVCNTVLGNNSGGESTTLSRNRVNAQ